MDHRLLLSFWFRKGYTHSHCQQVTSKKLGYTDGWSRLIPKFSEALEDMVISTLRDKKELSVLLYDTIQELPVTLEDIKKKKKQLRKMNLLKE